PRLDFFQHDRLQMERELIRGPVDLRARETENPVGCRTVRSRAGPGERNVTRSGVGVPGVRPPPPACARPQPPIESPRAAADHAVTTRAGPPGRLRGRSEPAEPQATRFSRSTRSRRACTPTPPTTSSPRT